MGKKYPRVRATKRAHMGLHLPAQGSTSVRGWVGYLISSEPFPTPPPSKEGFGHPQTLPPYPLGKGGKNQRVGVVLGWGIFWAVFPTPLPPKTGFCMEKPYPPTPEK